MFLPLIEILAVAGSAVVGALGAAFSFISFRMQRKNAEDSSQQAEEARTEEVPD